MPLERKLINYFSFKTEIGLVIILTELIRTKRVILYHSLVYSYLETLIATLSVSTAFPISIIIVHAASLNILLINKYSESPRECAGRRAKSYLGPHDVFIFKQKKD